jgi:integrase
LIARLKKLKGKRTTGRLFVSEMSSPDRPTGWAEGDLRRKVSETCKAAGLPGLTLSQFRKGGLTEAGSAGLSTSQIMARSIHLNENTVHIFVEKNPEVAVGGQEMRLRYRNRKAKKRGIDIVT